MQEMENAMEYRIEIVGTETRQLFRQLYSRALFRGLLIATGLFLLAAVLAFRLGSMDEDASLPALSAVYILFAGLIWLCPIWFGTRAYQNKLKYYDGVMPESTVRFGDQIVIADVDSTHTIPYDKLTRLCFMKNGIAFVLGKQKMIGIPNETFTKGSLQELKQFLREKRPDLKIPE